MFKRLSVLAFTLTALLMFSQPVSAREFADIFTECGIGAMIAPNNEAVAAVTNVTWDCGTTAGAMFFLVEIFQGSPIFFPFNYLCIQRS